MIGCIADAYTGATDVASAYRQAGLRTVLTFGRPTGALPETCDAIVIALATRHLPAQTAVRRTLDARAWLREHGATQIYFKYGSAFDSTDDGNIGPVADALVRAQGGGVAVICPASPEHDRTVYQGHLFLGDRPSANADLVQVLTRQTASGVMLVPHSIVRQGTGAIRAAIGFHPERFAVVDAITEEDLRAVAAAVVDAPVVTGAAGLARALAQFNGGAAAPAAELPDGPAVIIAGGEAPMTRTQIAHACERCPSLEIAEGDAVSDAVTWLETHLGNGPVMLHAASDVEPALGALARHAVDWGVKRIVVAGSETSGLVVDALQLSSAVVGEEADRGVPWLVTDHGLAFLLKAGHFGQPDLLVRAAS